MAELIAIGNAQTNSADFTVAAGGVATLYIKPGTSGPASYGATYLIQHKTSAGAYVTVYTMLLGNPAINLTGAGTFRAQRQAGQYDTGMDIQQ